MSESDNTPGVRADFVLEPLDYDARYSVLDELGRGGVGAVVMCEDRQVGRRVAMKMLHERGAEQAAALGRFVREARVQGQLEHPAIVPVYDLGVDPSGTVFFTMKRVRGTTLKAALRKLANPLEEGAAEWSERRLLAALSTVCLAVDFAHRRGVLHRDIKPANIMLGDFGEVYLLDWGLARLHGDPGEAPADAIDLGGSGGEETRASALLGTPGYMAPEQLTKKPSELGPACDVYALGAVLFELLTLERLHRGSPEQALESTLRGDLDAPSARAPAREIAPELDAICAKATALAPEARFASARELHAAIQRHLDGRRDEELRRELSEKHVAAARAAEDRRSALREIGRALALDPQNQHAIAMLLGFLKTPPERTPDAVQRELDASFWKQVRAAGKVAGIAYLSLFLYAPLFWWSGIRDAGAVGLFYALAFLSAALAFFVASSEEARPGALVLTMLASNATFASSAAFFGALVLTPGLVAVNTGAYVLLLKPRLRWPCVAAGALAVLLPALPEVFGSQGRYVFDAAGMLVTPGAIDLSRAPALMLLLVGSVATVLTGAVTNAQVRDALTRAEERRELQAWQLGELAPTDAE